MSYLVLLRFNSQQNVDMFLLGPQATPLHAEEVKVPSGYTPPAPGIGSPGSSAVSDPKFIILAPDTLSQIPQGYQPLITYDLSPSTGPVIVGPVSPTINPSQLTVKGGPTFDNTIINQGIPTTNYTDQLPPPPGPIDFQPIYYDPALFEPTPLSQQPLIEVTPPGEIPEINYNPYLLTPQPLIDVQPPDYFPPPGITDPRVIPVSDYYWPTEKDTQISKDPYNPNLYYPENPANPDYYDPINPKAIVPFDTEPPIPGEKPYEVIPWGDSPDPHPIPIPYPDLQQPQPTGQGGGGRPGIGSIFVGLLAAQQDGNGNDIGNSQIVWSVDGLSWNAGNNAAGNFLNLEAIAAGINYFNGIWTVSQRYTYAVDSFGTALHTNMVVYSYDGKNWLIGMIPNRPDLNSNVTQTNDTVNNRLILSNPNNATAYLYCQVPATPTLVADTALSSPKDDPSQPATGAFGYLLNSLTGGATAVRFNANNSRTFDITYTQITTTIVNSGATWPAATWYSTLNTTPNNQTLSTVAYGPPSGPNKGISFA